MFIDKKGVTIAAEILHDHLPAKVDASECNSIAERIIESYISHAMNNVENTLIDEAEDRIKALCLQHGAGGVPNKDITGALAAVRARMVILDQDEYRKILKEAFEYLPPFLKRRVSALQVSGHV